MRFDLEIPAITSTKLVYVSEGDEINPSLVPLSYYAINNKDMFIDDFITAENAFSTREFLADGYEVKKGPAFDVASDKILITHVAKFVQKEGVRVPLFYKHVLHENVPADVIKIFDYYNTEVSKDDYIVETFNNKTYVYMNQTNKILFIEYVSGVGFNKTILDLVPVYQEATWENLAINGTISDFEYMIDRNVARTNYNGDMYVSNINNIRLFRNPTGNIDDPWHVGILNSNFTVTKNGKTYRYTTPEYYRQRFDGDDNLKIVTEKKCRKVYPNVIKSQYNISRRMYDSVYVYIKDFYTNETKYALTTNSFYFNSQYTDNVYYAKLDNVSYDGYILLPITLSDSDVAYVTHFTEDDYYEYSSFNVNSLTVDQNSYAAFYLIPNVSDTGSGISHKIIGDNGDFGSYEEYSDFIENNNYLHVALISTTAYFNKDFINIYDVRQQSDTIKNKYEVCKKDVDLIYNELINGNLLLPTNDAVVAKLDTTRLVEEKRFKFSQDLDGLDGNTSANLISMIKEVIDKNLDVSTKSIIEINTPR